MAEHCGSVYSHYRLCTPGIMRSHMTTIHPEASHALKWIDRSVLGPCQLGGLGMQEAQAKAGILVA